MVTFVTMSPRKNGSESHFFVSGDTSGDMVTRVVTKVIDTVSTKGGEDKPRHHEATSVANSSGTEPRIVLLHGMIKPETGTSYIAHMGGASERTHDTTTIRVVVQFALGILHAVLLFRSEHDTVLRELCHSETLMIFLVLHGCLVMKLAIIAKLILPRFLNIMQIHH